MATNFLVTGATGFIGRRLCRHITERGDTVTAAVRRTSSSEPISGTGAQRAEVDLQTGVGLRAALRDVDCVLHLAGVVKAATPAMFLRGNLETTRTLVRALELLPDPPRLVVCSSLAAAGPAMPGRPRTETDPACPVSWYGLSKLAAENAARASAEYVPTVVVRAPIVYGPGDPAFLPSLLPMMRLRIMLKPGAGASEYSMIHVDDLCRFLLLAADHGRIARPGAPASGVYFASDGSPRSWEQVCHAMTAALDCRPPRIVPLPDTAVRAAGWLADLAGNASGAVTFLNADKVRELRCAAWTCTVDKAHRDLGFVADTSFVDGIATALGQ